MKEIIINAEQLEQKLFESSRFHRYRIAFNSAFYMKIFLQHLPFVKSLPHYPN